MKISMSTLGRRLRRISQASWAELRFRGAQEFLNRWDGLRYQLGFTRPANASIRPNAPQTPAPRFFFSCAQLPVLTEVLQQRFPGAAQETIARAEVVCAHRFDLLGYKNLDFGREIDWHLDPVHNKRAPRKLWYEVPYLDFNVVGDVKITWELNRHQHFVTLGKAFRLTRDEKYAREFVSEFYSWMAVNPYPVGVNWASSLEVAFRTLSWLWARELFADSSSLPEQFRPDLLAALERNARFIERNLSFYFSPNTHLLGEGVALFFVGVLCPDLRAATSWRERGWQIILDAASQQVRPDGGYFEQSTYYHVYALDFFLHARILGCENNIPIPAEFDHRIVNMLEYLAALGTSGPPPRFGDDDGGRIFDPARNCAEHLLDPLSTGAVLFRRPDFKAVAGSLQEETLWLLGPAAAGEFDRLPKVLPLDASRAFPETGTYILAADGLRLAMDAGPLGSARGGHGHADTLSVCVAADGSDRLVDQGTFTYTGSPEDRDLFRGTRSHNTLVVDGLDQAMAVDPFAWDRFPKVQTDRWLPGETFDLLEASHDGYSRLSSPVRHRRLVFFVKGRFWLVLDAAEGHGRHDLEIFWHGSPAGFHLDDSRRALALSDLGGFAVLPATNPGWSIRLVEGAWSPNYGVRESRPALRFHANANLPAEFATLLIPRVSDRNTLGTLEPRRGNQPDVSGYQYVTSAERHVWIFAATSETWDSDEFSSDARVLYCMRDKSGRIDNVVLCGGSFLAVHGEKFLVADRPSERIEYRRVNGSDEIFPSGAARVVRPTGENNAEMAPAAAHARRVPDRTQR
jgi:hypothetical protein